MNGTVIPDTIKSKLRAGLSPEFLSPYADREATNRPVLLHQLSDATRSTFFGEPIFVSFPLSGFAIRHPV